MPTLSFKKSFRLPTKNLNITMYLIAINAVVFFLSLLWYRPVMEYLAMWVPAVILGPYWWTPFTYMFVHAGPTHLIFNMLALFFIGSAVEHRAGSIQYLIFYLVGGLFAGLVTFLGWYFTNTFDARLLGASGAVYAVLVAYACFFPRNRLYIMGILPVRAPYLVIGYGVLDILMGSSSQSTGIAHLTHLSGLLFGILAMFFVYRINFIDTLRP